MPSFEELMNIYRTASEDAPIPEDFADQLEQAYRNDLSVRDTAVDSRTRMLEERENEINRLKAHNYDLLRQIPADPPKSDKDQDNDENEDDGEYTGTISEFLAEKFKKKG
jgi:hypothetical protein